MSTAQPPPSPPLPPPSRCRKFPEERMFTLLCSISLFPSAVARAPSVAWSNRLHSFCVCKISSEERQGQSELGSDGHQAETQRARERRGDDEKGGQKRGTPVRRAASVWCSVCGLAESWCTVCCVSGLTAWLGPQHRYSGGGAAAAT